MSERPSHPLWAPMPGEVKGLGRLRRILREYPVAPLELMAGFGAICRGQYVLNPAHDLARTAAWSALERYHVNVTVMASAFVGCGLAQILGALYEWQRVRAITSALLFGLVTWLIVSYLFVERTGWGPSVYTAMWCTQLWILCRSMPLVRWRR